MSAAVCFAGTALFVLGSTFGLLVGSRWAARRQTYAIRLLMDHVVARDPGVAASVLEDMIRGEVPSDVEGARDTVLERLDSRGVDPHEFVEHPYHRAGRYLAVVSVLVALVLMLVSHSTWGAEWARLLSFGAGCWTCLAFGILGGT